MKIVVMRSARRQIAYKEVGSGSRIYPRKVLEIESPDWGSTPGKLQQKVAEKKP